MYKALVLSRKFWSARAKICDKFGPPLKFLVRAQRWIIWRRATLASGISNDIRHQRFYYFRMVGGAPASIR